MHELLWPVSEFCVECRGGGESQYSMEVW